MQDKKLQRKMAMEELTRKDILDSAITVVLEKGMKGFTMDRVASGAGIAKGTLYLYFKNKQELLESVVDYCFEPLDKEFEEIIRTDRDPILKLEQCALAAMNHTEVNRPLLYEMRSVVFSTMDQHISDQESWYWSITNLFSSALHEAIKAGKIRSVNTVKIAALFLDSIDSLMARRILSTVTDTIEEDVRDLMDLFINGLSLRS